MIAWLRLLELLERLLPRRRPTPPPELDATEPFPLTHKDVQQIQQQIRTATELRPEIPPPSPGRSSRYR